MRRHPHAAGERPFTGASPSRDRHDDDAASQGARSASSRRHQTSTISASAFVTSRRTSRTRSAARTRGDHPRLPGWQDRPPDLGRPQDQINELVDGCDVFMGFVNPSGDGVSHRCQPRDSSRGSSTASCETAAAMTSPPHRRVLQSRSSSACSLGPGQEFARVLKFRRVSRLTPVLYGTFATADALAHSLRPCSRRSCSSSPKCRMRGTSADWIGARPSPPAGALVSEDPREVDEAQERIAEMAAATAAGSSKEWAPCRLDRDRLGIVALALAGERGLVPTHVADPPLPQAGRDSPPRSAHGLSLRTLLPIFGT